MRTPAMSQPAGKKPSKKRKRTPKPGNGKEPSSDSVSSAAAMHNKRRETKNRGRVRYRQPTKFDARSRPMATSAPTLPAFPSEPSEFVRCLADNIDTTVGTISDLKATFPHIEKGLPAASSVRTADGKTVEAVHGTEGKGGKAGGAADRELPHTPIHQVLVDHVAQMGTVLLTSEIDGKLGHDELATQLREHRQLLPVASASTESLLLGEAGKWPFRNGELTWPACEAGDQCLGRLHFSSKHRPSGVLLTQYMTDDELVRFIASGVPPGASEKRKCVLCTRLHMHTCAAALTQYGHLLPKLDDSVVLQPYAIKVNTDDGYKDQVCQFPDENAWRGHEGPFVRVNLAHLALTEPDALQGGRCHIDQSALIYQHPTHFHASHGYPVPPMQLADFRKRSRELGGLFGARERLHYQSICLFRDPRRHLLRMCSDEELALLVTQPPLMQLDPCVVHAIPGTLSVIKAMVSGALAKLSEAEDTPRNRKLSFWFGLWLDRLERPGEQGPDLDPATGFDVSEHIYNCHFDELNRPNMDKELTDLIDKSLPQPCAIRKYPEMIEAFVSAHPYHIPTLAKWVACSLTGSYPHVKQADRPPHHVRLALLDKLRADPKWMVNVIRSIPLLGRAVIQDMLVWKTHTLPLFAQLCRSHWSWEGFCTFLERSMSSIRTPLSLDLLKHKGADKLPPDRLATYTDIMNDLKAHMIVVGHARSRSKFVAKLPTIQQHKDGVWVGESDPVEGLTPEKVQFLRRWARNCDTSIDPFDTEVPLMVHMGASQNGVDRLCQLRAAYDRELRRLGGRALGDALEQAYRKWPYTYEIVRYFCKVFTQSVRTRAHTLSANMLTNQMDALKHRVGSDGKFPHDAISCVFCTVCSTVYSICSTSKPQPQRVKLHAGKAPWLTKLTAVRTGKSQQAIASLGSMTAASRVRYGYNGMRSSLQDGMCYCERNETRMRMTCQGQPLASVSLLGRAVVFNRTVFMLCPQVGCGSVMVYRRSACDFNSRGVMCPDCTKRHRMLEEERFMLVAVSTTSEPLGCAVCNTKILDQRPNATKGKKKDAQCGWVLPHGLLLCRMHAKPQIIKMVPRWPNTSSTAVLKSLTTAIKAQKSYKRDMGRRSANAALSRSRRLTRDPRFGRAFT